MRRSRRTEGSANMPEPRPLPDQTARDIVRGRLDINLLVDAGAGSGKTECLAQRMAAGIREGHYRVEEMAAVTFTRKAAAELRGRFQLALEAHLVAETDPVRGGRLEEALRHLERLFAGTIHAFCAHLLRERPIEAGVAPGFAELDEAADLDQRRRAWREYLERQRAEGSPTLQELIEAGVRAPDLDRAFDLVCRFPEVDFPARDGAAPGVREAAEALGTFWQGLRQLLPASIDPHTTCKVQLRARDLGRRLQVADVARAASLAELLGPWHSELSIVQKWWADTAAKKKAMRDNVDRLLTDFRQNTVEPFFSAWYLYVYRLAITLLLGGRRHAEESRRRALTLNYGDLLQCAAILLRDNTAVREALQRKYRWLFVDEFQDTDPIQAEVIFLLAAEPSPERAWARVALRPGALFIVGDPKQSIYRFRRADIDTYLAVGRRIEETGGQIVSLTTSFRSVPALCNWANTAFGDLFPAEATVHQPAFRGLAPVRAADTTARAGVRTLSIADTVAEPTQADADAIARFIRGELDVGRRQPGDFLILSKIRRDLGVYARALEAYRIPVDVSGGGAFAQSTAVGALASLLSALADPDDGLVVVGVLRGPLFGLTDPDLFRHRTEGRPFRFTLPEVQEWPGPVGEALAALHEMYSWTRRLPFPAAVERILETTGLLARAVTLTAGGAEAGDLLHAVDRVRRVTEIGGTLADAAQALRDDLESSDVESVSLEPGRRDVVRLMNLHKAKGLEAPVVFLANPLRGGIRSADVRIVRDGLRAVGYFPIQRPAGAWGKVTLGQPQDWAQLEQDELAYVDAEQDRLLYVAATRARDLLVISRCAKSGRYSRAWERLEPFLRGVAELDIPAVAPPPPRPLGDLGPEARTAAESQRESWRDRISRPSWQVESVTATTHRAAPFGTPVEAGRTREPDTGIAWGSLIHFLLEHAMRGPHRDRTHLERLAKWFTFDKPELHPVIPEALDTIERVMVAEFWQRAMTAEERHVEAPFAVTVNGAGGAPCVLHGVIDLAFKTPAGWELIDYKTDQADLSHLVERYGDQIKAYAGRWADLTAGPIGFAGLYSVRHQQLSQNLHT
jgi:ATP-dependent helicase/nuclease subunit A